MKSEPTYMLPMATSSLIRLTFWERVRLMCGASLWYTLEGSENPDNTKNVKLKITHWIGDTDPLRSAHDTLP